METEKSVSVKHENQEYKFTYRIEKTTNPLGLDTLTITNGDIKQPKIFRNPFIMQFSELQNITHIPVDITDLENKVLKEVLNNEGIDLIS